METLIIRETRKNGHKDLKRSKKFMEELRQRSK